MALVNVPIDLTNIRIYDKLNVNDRGAFDNQ